MKTEAHYDQGYYASHYTQILGSERYYGLLAAFWKRAIFTVSDLPVHVPTLDYGCGLGQVTAALENVTFFDHSEFAREQLGRRGLKVVDQATDIPRCEFDLLVCSHSLEHSPTPREDLLNFRDYLRPGGRLILILPVEPSRSVSLKPDANQHFYCWTFQTITNLLLHCGWKPLMQRSLFGPFGLNTLGNKLPTPWAVEASYRFGAWGHKYPSLMTVAQPADR